MAEKGPSPSDEMPEFAIEAARNRALEKQPLHIFFTEFWWGVVHEVASDKASSMGEVIRDGLIHGLNTDPNIETYKRRAARGIEFDVTEDILLQAAKSDERSGIVDAETVTLALSDTRSWLERRIAYQREGEEPFQG